MGAQPQEHPSAEGWTITGVEQLLSSLSGVLSARVVSKPGGEIQEVHLLTTTDVGPKQTVRNVESALLTHFDLTVDHRKISVAQTSKGGTDGPGSNLDRLRLDAAPMESRILFAAVRTESQRSQVHFEVEVEFEGRRFRGEATGADVGNTRMSTVATATLGAVEDILRNGEEQASDGPSLALDGVKIVEAFERRYALTAVHALNGRTVHQLNGLAVVEDSLERAVILATLQATDRWIRGKA